MSMFDKIAIADGTQLLLGRGAIFFDRFSTAGAKQGFNFVGNATALELAPSVDTREKRGVVDNTNPLLARVEVSRTLEVNLTLSEYKKEQVAMALLGDVATGYTQSNTPVVGETLTTSSVGGRTYFTAKRKIGTVAVKVSAVTKANGTDYEYDSETGAVKILSTGTIADGSTVTIDYTPATISGAGTTTITPGTAGTILGELRFVGKPMNGLIHEVHLFRVQISPAGVLALISDDFVDFQLKGTVLSDATNNPTQPFGRAYQY